MPIYEIQTPNGKVLSIEAGDEATAMKGAAEWFSQNGPSAQRSEAAPQTPPAPSQKAPGPNDEYLANYKPRYDIGPMALPMFPKPQETPPSTDVPPENPSRWQRAKNLVTGELNTEFPEAREFAQAYETILPKEAVPAMQAMMVKPGDLDPTQYAPEQIEAAQQWLQGRNAVTTSSVSPDPQAQLDVLRKQIPGLEAEQDRYGNIMLRAPGMQEWTYLNKPGASNRDAEEFVNQSALTAPFLGPAGKGITAGGKALWGALGLGSASVGQDVAAMTQGSEQGVDPWRAGLNATVGAVTPAIAPLVEGTKNLVGRALRSIAGTPKGRESVEKAREEAFAKIQVALDQDRRVANAGGSRLLTERQIGAAQAQGQPAVNLDMGSTALRRLARDAANKSPEAQGIIESVVDKRYVEQARRILDRLQGTVSTKASAYESQEALKRAAKEARTPLYKAAYDEGRIGHMSDDLQKIIDSPEGKKAFVQAEKTMANRAAVQDTTGLNGTNGYTLEFWDVFKQSLDDATGSYLKSGEKSLANTSRSMKDKLVGELDAAFPSYKDARGTASEFFKAGDALEAGQKFSSSTGFDLAKSKDAISRMTDPEKVMFREGFISDVKGKAEDVAYRRDLAATLLKSPAQKQKFEAVLGRKGTEELEAYMHVENLMELSHRAIVGNSTSARQVSDLGSSLSDAVTQSVGTGIVTGSPIAGILTAVVAQGRKMMGDKFDSEAAQRVSTEIAKILASKDTEIITSGISKLSTRGEIKTLRQLDEISEKMGLWKFLATKKAADEATVDDTKPTMPKALRKFSK